jgi:hypothetical protein
MKKLLSIIGLCAAALCAHAGSINYTTTWCSGGTPGCPAPAGFDSISVTAYPIVYNQQSSAQLYGSNDGRNWFPLATVLFFSNDNTGTAKGTVTRVVTVEHQANFYQAVLVNRLHKN